MEYTIHFRGVAVFTAKADRVPEVLFPNAETSPPPEGSTKKIQGDDGSVIAELMMHADNTPAPKHFAGALIVGPKGERTYRKLLHRHVTIGDGDGAELKGALRKELPPLVDVITDATYALRLLDRGERSDRTRVATRFSLNTGRISSDHQSNLLWTIGGGKPPVPSDGKQYFVGAKVKIQGGDTFEITVTDFTGETDADETIRLDKDHSTVFFYNFDSAMPTIGELTKPDHHSDFKIDHDFKWIYRLFNRVNPELDTWVKWLNGEKFPAPARASVDLIPVSTCFETVWPEVD